MKLLLFLCVISISSSLLGQFSPSQAPAETEITFGITNSRFKSDSLEVNPLSSFNIGFRATSALSDNYFFRASARFSTRGYNNSKWNGKLRNRYLDAELNVLRELFPGLRFEIGVAAHFLYRSTFNYKDPGLGFQEISTTPDNWSSYLDGFVGAELRMEEKISLGLRYYPEFELDRGAGLVAQIALSLDNTWASGERALIKEQADRTIVELKNGVILIRLKRLTKSIEALKRMGEPLKAEEVKRKIESQNRDLMKAFKSEFDFCEVRFFYSDDSNEIRSGNFEGKLMDSNGEVAQLPKGYSEIYFADTGPLQADTSLHYYDYQLISDGDFSSRRIKRKYSGQAMGFGALAIKDKNFVNLSKPLPYYVKTYGNYLFLRKPKRTVSILNINLHEYYSKVSH